MATIVIRKLDETVKRKLQVRAAQNGRSMEAEARDILSAVVTGREKRLREEGLGTAINKHFAALGGMDFRIPPRKKSHRPIPTFE